jgi:hypothetical protein
LTKFVLAGFLSSFLGCLNWGVAQVSLLGDPLGSRAPLLNLSILAVIGWGYYDAGVFDKDEDKIRIKA